ncbi:CYTH domain-containing protein [Jeotgalibacillus sp. ET6]|uniref:CYTH domain-containing protein n=1 Tax=Jeotgalibacillus sp. ET6 TaxID=3037260 RepID=UPI0024188021|nr:CYTH domain-containing protein [Jeotgalibacillus sp. ET6]MDG5473002.1 CYTH domain-containing protein [Jeotgalibacillus sp. ET6]
MSQELEIEFKNLLTKEEFHLLCGHFQVSSQESIRQKNHYFDTPDFQLKKIHSALRIREKSEGYQLTLKKPVEKGILENHQWIDSQEASQMLEQGGLVQGEIAGLLEELKIPVQQIIYFGTLATERIEFPYKNGLLVLDHSTYLNKEDFELEYEAASYDEGQAIFKELLSTCKISAKKTDNKIERFYKEKIRRSLL